MAVSAFQYGRGKWPLIKAPQYRKCESGDKIFENN
jgi:hypothetical protein